MANKVKKVWKKVLSATVIIAVVLFAVSFGTTKIVYDSCFPRYDTAAQEICEELEKLRSAEEKYEFLSGGNSLSGYHYRSEYSENKGLIVIAPGMNATSTDYLWVVKAFTENGYGVFIFDPTGCGESEGKSAVGFPQLICDLKAAIVFLETQERLGYENIFLFGHSRGGYAVCCAAAEAETQITAVVSVNGINSAMEGVMMPAVKVIGNIAYANYPLLKLYQIMLFGADNVDASAIDSLNKADIPALIIHSSGDTVVPEDRFSIASHESDAENSDIIFITGYGETDGNSHTEILFGKDGKANSELIQLITDFFDKAAGN